MRLHGAFAERGNGKGCIVMETRSRAYVRGETLVVGVVAWLALNAFVYVAAPLFGISIDFVGRFFGSLLVPRAAHVTQLWVGRALFLAAAIGWTALYRWVRTVFSGPGWLRGLLFGTAIWFVTALVLPLFGAVHALSGSAFGGFAGQGGIAFPGFFGFGFVIVNPRSAGKARHGERGGLCVRRRRL